MAGPPKPRFIYGLYDPTEPEQLTRYVGFSVNTTKRLKSRTMSRSGYVDNGDIEQWDLIRWRGAVASAIRGKRGEELRAKIAELKSKIA